MSNNDAYACDIEEATPNVGILRPLIANHIPGQYVVCLVRARVDAKYFSLDPPGICRKVLLA